MEGKGTKGNTEQKQRWLIIVLLLLSTGTVLYFLLVHNPKSTLPVNGEIVPMVDLEDPERIVDGVHVRTGFKVGEGMQEVINNCTSCHSSKLVTQNRMDREGWINTIRWMQETQNLWDLGPNEEIIVEYLSKHYSPVEKGRREPLKNVEWYTLK
ncbi:MAG: monoheme cytochrome C [Sediminicola sp.]|tara:strand:+ start:44311 stop:44772 length:462 start_codon:yes stop_codon:yes gene_type:complete